MSKGTIFKEYANVKTMDGSPASGLRMEVGDYAFGDVSPTKTDLINFDHFYRANGTLVNLGKPSKATAANMNITNESETPTPPDPNPEPTPPDPESVKEILYSDVTYVNYAGATVTIRLFPGTP